MMPLSFNSYCFSLAAQAEIPIFGEFLRVIEAVFVRRDAPVAFHGRKVMGPSCSGLGQRSLKRNYK